MDTNRDKWQTHAWHMSLIRYHRVSWEIGQKTRADLIRLVQQLFQRRWGR